ncbi:HSF-type DNA-binding protein [Phytophthora megakarya]|uniref:HSF-type DNA-binding protein n=1 Tax=Phytophthora megakarya TaxID=4795 RepID=A0A225X157_9STRA|nr:HSF-type DNA-binding protein [Phytophthora megakarya]
MVAQTLAMDPIAQRIDMKQEPQTDADSSKRRPKARTPRNETPNGWDLATIKEGGKRAKPEAPKFLLLLYEILDVESSRVIRWSEDGLALQILDPVTVTEQILPKYFNHTNFHSFQRQLNYFGFRKWTKSKTDICTFSHPFFRENQPELLQLIKRKKAPRRTPSGANTTPTGASSAANSTSKKLSPCGKRKLPSESSSDGLSTGMHIQMNTAAVPIQPAINGMPLGSMTTPHGASSNGALGFSQDGLTRQYLPELNNVISPVAATECKKKAKKMDKKDYLSNATIHAPLTSPSESSSSLTNSSTVPSMSVAEFMPTTSMSASNSNNASMSNSSRASSENGFATAVTPTSTQLPNLNIVRSRLIQRQQAGRPEQQQPVLQQQYDYNGFSTFSNGPQGMAIPTMESRPELLVQSMAPRADLNPGQSPVFSNSFSDPVNILLRIKKSRTSSGDGKDVGTKQEVGDDQNENLTSLHNYLLGNSLYTNRLQAQLKFVAEENEALKHLLDTKQREVDSLQSDRKVLQQENAVLLEDKNKLFEINRDLLSKLFPQ